MTESSAAIPTFKIIFVGDTCANKTSIINCYHHKRAFCDDAAPQTVGAAYIRDNVSTKSGNCVFEIWDTAGSEKYRSLAPMYYKKSHAIVIAVNANTEGQFESLQNWLDSSNEQKESDDTLIVIAAVYSANENLVELDKIKNFSDEHKLPMFQLQFNNIDQISQMFDFIATRLLEKAPSQSTHPESSGGEEQDQKKTCSIY